MAFSFMLKLNIINLFMYLGHHITRKLLRTVFSQCTIFPVQHLTLFFPFMKAIGECNDLDIFEHEFAISA